MTEDITIPNQLIEKYRSELIRNPNKDFGEEFIRTTDLEASLIRQFGFSGLKLISPLDEKNILQLGSLPLECPWVHLNGGTHDEAIDTVFDALENKVPELISTMKERVRFIYATNIAAQWKLNYLLDMKLYDDRDYFLIYSGGAPEPDPRVSDALLEFNWTIPGDLREFYAVHNGFGAAGDWRYVLASNEISVMGKMMNPIAKEKNFKTEGYDFDDLLEFFPDGAGNAQCYLRKSSRTQRTVDWDHETWEISEESDFFEFIDSRLSELDEE